MLRPLRFAIAFTAVSLAVSVAFAEPPKWCKEYEEIRGETYSFHRMKLTDDPMDSTKAIVGGMCVASRSEHFAAASAAHKEWSTMFDMDDDDWAGAAQYWAMDARRDQFDVSPKQKGYWGLDPIDQWLVLRNVNAPGSGHYKADAMGELSALGRLGYVRWCMRTNRDSEVHLAACLPDIEALDMKKVAAELRADKKHDAWMRLAARTDYVGIRATLDEAKKKIADLKAKDLAYDKMFAIAAKTTKDWAADATKRQALLQFVGEMENAAATGSRKASDGCEAKALTALKTAISGISAKQFAGITLEPANPVARQAMRPIIADIDGNLAGVAYAACVEALGSKDNFLAWELRAAAGSWPGYRGPRTATISNIGSAGLELDARGAELKFPSVSGGTGNELGVQATGCRNGVLASAKPAGALQNLRFDTKSFSYRACADMRPGTRITAIRWDGRIERAGTCMKYETVTGTQKIEPVEVDPRYTTAIKPGMTVSACNQIVLVGWPKGGTVPSVVLGAPVK